MARLYADIAVQATAERVWQVLMDFASYPEWNPFVIRLEGDPREGAPLRAVMRVGGKDIPEGQFVAMNEALKRRAESAGAAAAKSSR